MSARFVAAIRAASRLAEALGEVLELVIVGPPSRAVARRSPEDRATSMAPEQISPCPSGLVPCPTCGTEQAQRDGRPAVHFAAPTAQRPCPGSWPGGSR